MLDSPVKILIVDDDEIAVMHVQRELTKHGITNEVLVANDGVEGLDILFGRENQKPILEPVMVLLDINMPRMNGLEFLRELRGDPQYCQTIVFMHTTSDDPRDRDLAYAMNVAGYLIKSDRGAGLLDQFSMLRDYLKCVRFPHPRRHGVDSFHQCVSTAAR